MRKTGWIAGAASAAAAMLTTPAAARPVINDIEFVTVGAPGNRGYNGTIPPGYLNVQGRGAVNYEYRIGKYETTTAQWVEFVNNYSVLGGSWSFFGLPSHWGAVNDPSYIGPGNRYVLNPALTNAGMMPVYGISWREAAMMCNWLHNDKAPTLTAISNGAYDTSLFTTNPNGTFNEQLTHHPDAKYWIPTYDEHIKATHYDPNRYGPGQGGWWEFPNMSDTPLVGGPPGVGQANAGFTLPNFGQYYIPLGSYPDTRTPWGLLDASGAALEHTELWWFPNGPYTERGARGAGAGLPSEPWDRVYAANFIAPHIGHPRYGVRIASAIPAQSTALLVLGLWWCAGRHGRRRS